jgi:N-acetylmuramoyl-L-alanine amidase
MVKNILAIVLILTFSLSANAQKVLFLDAGHGGKDPGGIAATGVTEAEINQAFVTEIKQLAEAKGIKVVLLSDAKVYTPAKDRLQKVTNYKFQTGETAMLVSIHANFDEKDPSKNGPEVMVLPSKDRSEGSSELAKKLQVSLGAPVIERGLMILKGTKMPAVVIETGYLSNEVDLQNLTSPDMRTLLVRKIVEAL